MMTGKTVHWTKFGWCGEIIERTPVSVRVRWESGSTGTFTLRAARKELKVVP